MDAHEGWTPRPVAMRVRVDDLDAVLESGAAAGARVVTPRTPLPQGVDGARMVDPWGNLWLLEQPVEDVDVTELVRRLADPATVEAVAAYETSLDDEMRRRA
jgi:PhnB protein